MSTAHPQAPAESDRRSEPARCLDCASFSSSPAELEQAFPGLASMGSGFSSVRWDDGLCAVHARYLPSDSSCKSFSRR
jgi:hypothetical protein